MVCYNKHKKIGVGNDKTFFFLVMFEFSDGEEAAEAFATAATRTPGRIPAVQGYETATSSLQAGVSDLLR